MRMVQVGLPYGNLTYYFGLILPDPFRQRV